MPPSPRISPPSGTDSSRFYALEATQTAPNPRTGVYDALGLGGALLLTVLGGRRVVRFLTRKTTKNIQPTRKVRFEQNDTEIKGSDTEMVHEIQPLFGISRAEPATYVPNPYPSSPDSVPVPPQLSPSVPFNQPPQPNPSPSAPPPPPDLPTVTQQTVVPSTSMTNHGTGCCHQDVDVRIQAFRNGSSRNPADLVKVVKH